MSPTHWPEPSRVGQLRLGERGALFTDHYQLVMAQLYWREGLAARRAQFDYFYRSNPDYGDHQAGYCISAGLGPLLEWLAATRFRPVDIDALRTVRTAVGTPTFDEGFLQWVERDCVFSALDLQAIAEGRVVHPHLPIVTVTGPIAIAQIIETALLNFMNYATLIATKAARVKQSATGSVVLEFGMRRGAGQAVDEAARAAMIGGCDATSNVEASMVLGTQPKGTHAHSLVQAYMALSGPIGSDRVSGPTETSSAAQMSTNAGELAAFRAFAEHYPDDCVLLVDTVDTLRSGVPNAITVFGELRRAGHVPGGVRLDSGDLAYLSVQAAKQLDEAGFPAVPIVLSSDLDELTIWQIRAQIVDEAPRVGLDAQSILDRLVYGVGTRLITSHGAGALGGVFKLVAIEDAEGEWVPAIKLSENPVKIPIPGDKAVWRLYDQTGTATVDLVTLPAEQPVPDRSFTVHHPYLDGVCRVLHPQDISRAEPLRSDPVGEVYPEIDVLRHRALADQEALDPGVRRLVNPHHYHVSLSDAMKQRQRDVIAQIRSQIDQR